MVNLLVLDEIIGTSTLGQGFYQMCFATLERHKLDKSGSIPVIDNIYIYIYYIYIHLLFGMNIHNSRLDVKTMGFSQCFDTRSR